MEKFVTAISYISLFYIIFNVSQELFKQSDFNKFDTEGNPTLKNYVKSYKKSLNKSEARIKEEFANSLTSFWDLFGEVCEFWQRPYYQSYENCQDDNPCQRRSSFRDKWGSGLVGSFPATFFWLNFKLKRYNCSPWVWTRDLQLHLLVLYHWANQASFNYPTIYT